jgi:hypothetical protein
MRIRIVENLIIVISLQQKRNFVLKKLKFSLLLTKYLLIAVIFNVFLKCFLLLNLKKKFQN